MIFHLIGLPHTKTSKEFLSCAFTQNIFNFSKMMLSLGHKVYHYGAEGSTVECTEHVQVISAAEQLRFFGPLEKNRTYPVKWEGSAPYWQLFNTRAADAINARKQRGDFVCLLESTHRLIAELVGESETIVCEPFVGSLSVCTKYRVFPSYTHQATIYGTLSRDPDGNLYDAVIPHFYDPADFPLSTKRNRGLLYIGRFVGRKGLRIVLEVAKATGRPLILAGQGVVEQTPEKIVTEEGLQIPLGKDIRYFGVADVAQRARLMGEAHAILMPTIYMEPFGAVAVEAQLCGTPVITTDHAAFSETVKHGFTGYRCHTLEQFCWAAENTKNLLPPEQIRNRAVMKYGLDHIRLVYQEWFEMLLRLWDEGWYAKNPARRNLNWLNTTGM